MKENKQKASVGITPTEALFIVNTILSKHFRRNTVGKTFVRGRFQLAILEKFLHFPKPSKQRKKAELRAFS